MLAPQRGPVGLTMLDARTGAVLRTLAVGGDFGDGNPAHHVLDELAVDARRGRVYVINSFSAGSDSVSVLDARTGGLLHTIGVGRRPTELAVDEATARLFVVNSNANCGPSDRFSWLPGPLYHFLGLQPHFGTCPGTVTVIDTAHL